MTVPPLPMAIAVLAKAPEPGRSKTRLSPPFSPAEAAELAQAMLDDALAAVAATPAQRRVIVLEGNLQGPLPKGFEVLRQRGEDHAERIGNAFTDIAGPALLIGMDTPQVSPNLLRDATDRLLAPGTDAVLGPAADGGWWAAGLKVPDATAFQGVPMSRADTVLHQRRRFAQMGLRWQELAELTDVDDAAGALQVAQGIPGSNFARLLRAMSAAAAGAGA